MGKSIIEAEKIGKIEGRETRVGGEEVWENDVEIEGLWERNLWKKENV